MKKAIRTLADIKARTQIDKRGCWIWQGALGKNGYGYATVDYRTRSIHRLAFELANGKPASNLVLHKCDNRGCCNPEHLYDGTYADNIQDLRERHPDLWEEKCQRNRETGQKRFRNGHRFGPHWSTTSDREAVIKKLKRGSAHPAAKLTEIDVVKIRRRASAGEKQTDLAREFGVSQTCIWAMITGKTWRSVPL